MGADVVEQSWCPKLNVKPSVSTFALKASWIVIYFHK